MFGRRWRSREEIFYMVKNDLKRSFPRALMMTWTVFIVVGAIVVKVTWHNDLPNWYATLIGIYFGVFISMFVYFRSQKSQRIMEEKIRKIEGVLNSHFPMIPKDIGNSNFQIYYALDSIINTYAEVEKIVKRWKKAKGENKKFLQEKIHYIWKNSMHKYSKILDNDEVIFTKLYEPKYVEKIKEISEKCKIIIDFDTESNEIKSDNFHRTVVDCIILLDKLKLDSQYRDAIFRY